jgi:hypothetical protein
MSAKGQKRTHAAQQTTWYSITCFAAVPNGRNGLTTIVQRANLTMIRKATQMSAEVF